MQSYGLPHAASYGNSSEKFNRINENIRIRNAMARTSKINDITNAESNNRATDPILRQTEDVSKSGLGVAGLLSLYLSSKYSSYIFGSTNLRKFKRF